MIDDNKAATVSAGSETNTEGGDLILRAELQALFAYMQRVGFYDRNGVSILSTPQFTTAHAALNLSKRAATTDDSVVRSMRKRLAGMEHTIEQLAKYCTTIIAWAEEGTLRTELQPLQTIRDGYIKDAKQYLVALT